MVSPDVVGIGSEYFVVYLSCLYMFGWLCRSTCSFVFTSMFGISHAVQNKLWNLHTRYRVIDEVLVLGLLMVVYKIPYRSCMWTRQDVIGVFPSYYCLSGTTCVPVIVQYITTSLLLLSTQYNVSWLPVSWLFDFIKRLQSLYLSRMNIVSADAWLSGSRRILVKRTV